MKFINLIVIFSVTTTIVFTQDPPPAIDPPAIDLPPPPPLDSPPPTDAPVDQPVNGESKPSAVSVQNDTVATKEIVNDTPILGTNETAPISEFSSGTNDSLAILPDLITPGDNIDRSGTNATVVTDVFDGLINDNVSDTSTNISSVKPVAKDTGIVNMTDIAATDKAISDILAAATRNDSVLNDISVSPNILSDNKTLMESVDNMTSIAAPNVTSEESVPPIDSNMSLTVSLDDIMGPGPLLDPLSQTLPVDLPPPPIAFDPSLEPVLAASDIGNNVSDISAVPDLNTVPVDLAPPPIPSEPVLEPKLAFGDMGTNVSDISSLPDLNTVPADLSPPPIPVDPVLEPELAFGDMGTNISDFSSIPDFNITSPTETNDTSMSNKTYVDPVSMFIDDSAGNMSFEHTPVETINPGSLTDQIAVGLPSVPVDLPPPPVDKPLVDFIETPGSTTIEISDLLAGLGSFDKSSPPMEVVIPDTTTIGMATLPPPDVPTSVPVYETTTVIPPDVYTTPTTFVEYATATAEPMLDTTGPVYRHVTEKGSPPPLDHPPPIFSDGSAPSIYQDQFVPRDGQHPYPDTTTPKVVTARKEAPPPPIIVPTRPDRLTNWPGQRFETTTSPFTRWAAQTPPRQTTLNPRYMNVAELAAYALKMSNKGKITNQPSQGIQLFFQTDPETTTTQKPTTLKPVYKQQNMGIREDRRSNSFIEYLRNRYGISNIGTTTSSYYATTAKPAIQPLPVPGHRQFYDAKYLLSHLPESVTQKPTMKTSFDSNYLLSHLDISPSKPVVPNIYATTMKPTTSRNFFDAKYLLSHLHELQGPQNRAQSSLPPTQPVTKLPLHLPQRTDPPRQNDIPRSLQYLMNNLNIKPDVVSKSSLEQMHRPSILKEQRQGQVETRPINLKPNINPQSFINYNVNPERNVRMNIHLKKNINQWGDQQKTTNPFTGMTTASFKPVVYGNKPFQNTKQSAGLSLRERFNRKWYHPKNKTPSKGTPSKIVSPFINEPIKNINIQIEEPIRRNQLASKPLSPVNTLLNRRGSGQNVNTGLKGTVSNRDLVIQQNSIELQRQILKQQEEKLRQQQQQLQAQQNLLRLQEQRKQQQQEQNYNLLLRQKEQERVRVHREQQKQNQQILYQQQEQERLHALQQQQKQSQNLLLQQQEQERLRVLQQQQNQNLLLQQQEEERLRLLKQQQQQEQLKQQLLLRQQEQDRLRLLKQQQQEQQQEQQLLLKQQEQERALQQQLQERLRLEQQRQREQALLRRQQFNRHSNQFPLASRTGQSEILQNNQFNNPQIHSYRPNSQVSSIQIFKAPAMMRRRKNQERKEAVPQSTQTHWHAPTDLHGHVPVPYKIKPIPAPETTPATPSPTLPVNTKPPPTVYIQTIATTVRPFTSSPKPTLPATADPNPPPIFDIKVRHTFMPMPKIEPTTQGPKLAENVSGWDGLPVNNQQSNLQMDDRCRGCVYVNDRCLLPDPVHCHFYIECVKQGMSARAFSRECALGSFFDRKSFLCVDPKNADCPTDRCRVPGTKWYAIHGHCKHYWSCGAREGGGVFAQSECCPEMGGFVEPVGCVENPNCTDTCSSTIVKEGPKGCQLRKTPSPTVYFDGNANIERPCAPGTLFNERACTCVQDVSIERSETRPGGLTNCTCSNETPCSCSGAKQATVRATSCLPKLSLTFDGGSMVDTSNTKQHVGIDGVSATLEGEAIYNGAGKLVIWRYANFMFPVVFAIKFRFFSTTPSPRKQIIFSNCAKNGGQEPSIEIALDTMFHEVIFKINTYHGSSKRFTIIYQQNKWTDVDFIYDGERIVGSVDKRARNIFAGGGIETRPKPIAIGSCNGKDGFKGLLDDVSIYEECIPDDMYGIFMSVLE